MSKVIASAAEKQASSSLFDLAPVGNKKVQLAFSAPKLSAFGGLAAIREYEKPGGIIDRIVSCIVDLRNQDFVVHSYGEMVRQRVYQIIAGYEDADDCDRLRSDGMLKLCAGRKPSDEIDLASQPTMCRLENKLTKQELYAIGMAFIDNFIASYDNAPELIVIDADDTNANTFGTQQLTLFNAYYGEYCYMPLLLFEGQSGKMILPILRPGRTNKAINISGWLVRLITILKKKWPHTKIIFRGDSQFCSHDFMDWVRDNKQKQVRFITGLAGNVKLLEKVAPWVAEAKAYYKETGKEIKVFHSFLYKAKPWKYQELVVVKIEVGPLGDNIRFIVTNILHGTSREKYSVMYCDRGNCELWIRELKEGLMADRMSCNRFSANQFRLFLHCAAYVIMHSFRGDMTGGTLLEGCTVRTFRERIILSAVFIDEKKTCIRLRLSQDHPMKAEFCTILGRLQHLPAS